MMPVTIGARRPYGAAPSRQLGRSVLVAGSVALSAALASPAEAQSSPMVNVSVDATGSGTPLQPVWPFFGFDEINYATSPEGKALLAELATANTAPVHVRSHFLFNTGDGTPALKWGSTNVYTEDGAGNPVYDWSLSDGIMDAITTAGAVPFVELGFMPQALSSHPTPYLNSSSTMLDGGWSYPPKDYAKWANLVRTWAMHADRRYPNVAQSWLWELWNEPDIPYWNGTFDEFTKLYDFTESALHEAIPNAKLGGPAVIAPAGTFLRQFLEHCASGTNAVTASSGTRLDHVTFHAKGGVVVERDHVQMNLGGQLRLHRVGFKAVAAFPTFKNTPIYVTEADPDGCAACPASSTPANAYRNSPAYGAYEMAMMKRSLELASELGVQLGGLLTWAFTFPGQPYFAGHRALTTNEIDLPVLGAFKLLGRLSGTRLALTSSGAHALNELLTNGVREQPEVDGMATLDGDTVRVLVWNYHDDLVAVPPTSVHLTVQVPSSIGARLRSSHLRVDERHGDAYTVWLAQGSPANPSAAQLQTLQEAMHPQLLVPDETLLVSPSGTVQIDFDLPRFGVSLVTLKATSDDGAPGGAGGGSTATSGEGGSAAGARQQLPNDCACRMGSGGSVTPLATLLGMSFVVLLARRRRRVRERFVTTLVI